MSRGPRAPGRVRFARAAATILAALLLGACAGQGPPREATLPADLPPSVELEAIPFFPQLRHQCGPAALATVLAASGVRVEPVDLAGEVYLPARAGSLQAELAAAARQRDRLAYLPAPTLEALLREVAAGRPVLVLQKTGAGPWPGWHYAVVVGYDLGRGRVLLRSGRRARVELPLGHFMATWEGAERWALVVVRPGELPATADLRRLMQAAAGLEAVGRREAAVLAYRSAAQAWPDEPLPLVGLANLSYASGDLAGAERELRAAVKRAPEDVVVRNNLAIVLLAMGCAGSARYEADAAARLAIGGSHAAEVAATQREVEAAGGIDGPGCPSEATWAHSAP
jgi:tetratricopeptide (TPR) repeat protein